MYRRPMVALHQTSRISPPDRKRVISRITISGPESVSLFALGRIYYKVQDDS